MNRLRHILGLEIVQDICALISVALFIYGAAALAVAIDAARSAQ